VPRLPLDLAVFTVALSAHWGLQFWSWSNAERGEAAAAIWAVLSAPVFYAVGSVADRYFWTAANVNSLLWAALLTYAADRLLASRQ